MFIVKGSPVLKIAFILNSFEKFGLISLNLLVNKRNEDGYMKIKVGEDFFIIRQAKLGSASIPKAMTGIPNSSRARAVQGPAPASPLIGKKMAAISFLDYES